MHIGEMYNWFWIMARRIKGNQIGFYVSGRVQI